MAIESSGSKPLVSTTVYQPDAFLSGESNAPDITVPFVYIDIIYDTSPAVAVTKDRHTLYDIIPTIVKKVVTKFLTPT